MAFRSCEMLLLSTTAPVPNSSSWASCSSGSQVIWTLTYHSLSLCLCCLPDCSGQQFSKNPSKALALPSVSSLNEALPECPGTNPIQAQQLLAFTSSAFSETVPPALPFLLACLAHTHSAFCYHPLCPPCHTASTTPLLPSTPALQSCVQRPHLVHFCILSINLDT